jgi:acetyltransferase-like isoleucine patch superfamily enzyme
MKILVDENIGLGAVVLPGISVGDDTWVGAGAAIAISRPEWSRWAYRRVSGGSGKQLRFMCQAPGWRLTWKSKTA